MTSGRKEERAAEEYKKAGGGEQFPACLYVVDGSRHGQVSIAE